MLSCDNQELCWPFQPSSALTLGLVWGEESAWQIAISLCIAIRLHTATSVSVLCAICAYRSFFRNKKGTGEAPWLFRTQLHIYLHCLVIGPPPICSWFIFFAERPVRIYCIFTAYLLSWFAETQTLHIHSEKWIKIPVPQTNMSH